MVPIELAKPITVDYEELNTDDPQELFPRLLTAFGDQPDCLGIVIVNMQSVPEYVTLRKTLLSYSSYLAALPSQELKKLENAHAKYVVGWSHGKEKLKSGAVDTRKGSYYANPIHNSAKASPALKEKFPEYTDPNVWPPSDILPGFKEAFERLGRLIVDVGALLAKACDEYAAAYVEGYTNGYIENVVRHSSTTKARLLHYFPPGDEDIATEEEDPMDSWRTCGSQHIDRDYTPLLLTDCLGLTPAMFVNETNVVLDPRHFTILDELESSPDPDAGLYIRTRSGKMVKVTIPKHCLAFQTGEALEIATDGKLRAVPHLVKGSQVKGIARNTLAVFIQNDLEDVLGVSNETFAEFASRTLENNLPS